MATRSRHEHPRGKPTPAKAKAPAASTQQQHATTPDTVRQAQALSNQGAQGRMTPSWRTRFGTDDEDEDDVPPTLH